jgi:hypothetical protein
MLLTDTILWKKMAEARADVIMAIESQNENLKLQNLRLQQDVSENKKSPRQSGGVF